jgi:hypothetical protein
MRKKAVQQGRCERRGESYSLPYVEPLSDARTTLADFFRILLAEKLNGPFPGKNGTTVPQNASFVNLYKILGLVSSAGMAGGSGV